jgi:hypothetical protein
MDPTAKGVTFKDSLDVVVDTVIHRMSKSRHATAEGLEYRDNINDGKRWKYDLLEDEEKTTHPHDFDQYVYT